MHVAITGASSGIGAALCREFAAHGCNITMVARRRDVLERLSHDLPRETFVVEQDLRDVRHAAEWIAQAEARLGPIDVLINNAGVQIIGDFCGVGSENTEAMLSLNLLTPLRLTAEVLPGMIRRGRGTIVDIASVAALAPTPWMAHYNASKAGLAGASEALRAELRGTGVHVVTVYPGPIDTPMAEAGYAAYGDAAPSKHLPIGTTKVLASRVRSAVERKRARVIYPRVYVLTRHFPGITRWLLDQLTPRPRMSAT